MNEQNTKNLQTDAAARSPSQRRMSRGRRLYYFFGLPLLRTILALLWMSYRVRFVGDTAAALSRAPENTDATVAPCYWHQQHVLCSYLIRRWIRHGLKAAFLVSDSVDGEVPSRLAQSWGAHVIRGSANRTGAAALRDMRKLVRDGVSIVTTADGPLGPKYDFKAGVILMAKLTGSELLPVACAAEKAWYLRRWDDFMIPKPFSRVAVGIGAGHRFASGLGAGEMETERLKVQESMMDLMARCEVALKS